MKKMRGITLVALVVTIIVLLILAGVSLQLIGGSSGILARATASVDKNNLETGKERVDLKIAEYKNDFYEEKYVDRSLEMEAGAKNYIVKRLQEEAEGEYGVTINGYGFRVDEEEKVQLIDKKGAKYSVLATGILTEEGIVVWDDEIGNGALPEKPEEPEVPTEPEEEIGSADEITQDYYGKYVTNYDESGHWQIFFSDLENIYLIYDDVIADPIYHEYSLTSAVDSGLYAQGTKVMLQDEERFPGYEWNYSTYLKQLSYKEKNHQAYLFIMDSGDVWNEAFLKECADYVIGGATPEMMQQRQGTPRIRETVYSGKGYGAQSHTCGSSDEKYYWSSAPEYGSESFIRYWKNGCTTTHRGSIR